MVFDMSDMYACIFAAGALGYLLNLLFIVVERRFVHGGNDLSTNRQEHAGC